MELGEEGDSTGAVTGLWCWSDAVVVRQQERGFKVFLGQKQAKSFLPVNSCGWKPSRFALLLSIFAFQESGNKEVEQRGWSKPVSPESPPAHQGRIGTSCQLIRAEISCDLIIGLLNLHYSFHFPAH